LALLHAFADLSEAEILGTGVCVSNPDVPYAVQAINEYYGRANIPIGQYQNGPEIERTGHAFVAPLRAMAKKQAISFPSTTTLYRQLLAKQPDNSLTFAAIGFMNTLHQLLLSKADEDLELSGLELIQTKVKKTCRHGRSVPELREHQPLRWC
jgi:pyrimidine-specific ribonucleoside hydrolase